MKRALFFALFPLIGLSACKGDKCESEAPSFQLDVELADAVRSEAKQLVVELQVGADRWQRTFDLSDKFADGKTSIAVDVVPAPSDAFEIKVVARAVNASQQVIAQGDLAQMARPNGCNQLQLSLAKTTPVADAGFDGGADAGPDVGPNPDAELDAGFEDALPDVPPIDTGAEDAGFEDVPENDLGPIDTGIFPDAEPLDDGVHPDADPPDLGPPDSGIVSINFAYTPANFTPNISLAVDQLSLNCGETIFDSATLTFTNPCTVTPPAAVPLMQNNGPEAALISVQRLTVASGSTLRITGSRPVIIAVYGEASVAGTITANAANITPGPGGSPQGLCTQGQGGSVGGRGGAGGGGFSEQAGAGGDGGNGDNGAARGNVETNALVLSPLRGGCSGGSNTVTGGGLGGAGGGALQISAASSLQVNGLIQATGGGGRGGIVRTGGGGGGSGGAVLLEADALTVATGSIIDTRGGGGGGGGSSGGSGDGSPGNDGNLTVNSGGAGGGNGGFAGGRGGNGASGFVDAQDGFGGGGGGSGGAGGGGGGAAGVIRLRGVSSCNESGIMLPQPVSGC